MEGELTPILVQMVKSANMNGLLDNDSDSLSGCQHRVKARLHGIMQKDQEFTEEDYDRVTHPPNSPGGVRPPTLLSRNVPHRQEEEGILRRRVTVSEREMLSGILGTALSVLNFNGVASELVIPSIPFTVAFGVRV